MAWTRTEADLNSIETNFLQKQMEIHLMEAHFSLVKAGACAKSCSDTHTDINEAIGLIAESLESKER